MGLASVRRSNGPYGFPVSRFHKGVARGFKEGTSEIKRTSPYSTISLRSGRSLHPPLRHRLRTMRPNAPHDPAVKLKEEPADMGLAVVLAPTSNDRVDLADQLLRTDWSLSTGALTDLVLEVPNGSLTRNRIARSPVNPAPDLRGSATSEAAGLA